MKNIIYISKFAHHIEGYIQFKCSLGYSASTYDEALKRFDRFCADKYPNATAITEELALRWCEKRDCESGNGRIRRMIALKGLLDYLSAIRIEAYIFPDGFIGQYKPYSPYLYSTEELKQFFRGVDTLPIHPLSRNRELIAPVIFRMLLCCGLRPQETVALRCNDVNLKNGSLYIANSKVHKDRVVAMSSDLCSLCRKYEDVISQRLPVREYFFQSPVENVPYTVAWQGRLFAACMKNAGMTFPTGKGPRVYSFRHNFATLVIKKWIDEGKNINTMLPYLSGYMGHSSLEDTAYYIHLVPEHLIETGLTTWGGMPEVPAYES